MEGQHVKAIAYWTAVSASAGLTGAQQAAVADAIAHLTARLTHLRNPSTTVAPLDR